MQFSLAELLWFADGGTTSNLQDPLTYLVDLGPIGVIIVLFVLGLVYPKSTVDRLIKENTTKDEIIKAKDDLINRMHDSLAEKAIPAITRSTNVLENIPQSERQSLDELRQLQNRLSELVAELRANGGGR